MIAVTSPQVLSRRRLFFQARKSSRFVQKMLIRPLLNIGENTPWHASGRKGDFSDVDRLIRIHSLRQLLYVLVVGSFVGCLFPKIQNQRKCSNFLYV